MSTKLNAEDMAAKRYPILEKVGDRGTIQGTYDLHVHLETIRRIRRNAYALAIREHSQPIADQRDELLEVVKVLVAAHDWAIANPDSPVSAGINYGHVAHGARAAIAKCTPKP